MPNRPRTCAVLGGLALLTLSACDPDYESTGYVRIVDNDGAEATYLVPDGVNVGDGPAGLGPVANEVREVWYATGEERSTYLLDGNLAAGIESGGFLQLPTYGDAMTVEDGGVTWQVVDADRPTYNSFRTYDSGACSLTLDWATDTLPGLVPAFAPAVAAAVDRQLARCGSPASQRFSRVGAALVEPIFRARSGGAGMLTIDDDVMRFTATYSAESVGGCHPVNLDISFEFGFRQGPEGEVIGFLDPQSLYAEVQDFCIAEDQIENGAIAALQNNLVSALESTLTSRTRIDPTVIDLPPGPACSTDADCAGAFPGTGHPCTDEVCELQLNVDRINVRPEGVELILMETEDDPQRPLLSSDTPTSALIEAFACGLDRSNGLLTPSGATAGTLASTSVPEILAASAICP